MSNQVACPFCATGINNGAVVCVGCQANSKYKRDKFLSLFVVILVICGFISSMLIEGNDWVRYLLTVVCLVGAYKVAVINQKKTIWYRRMN